jgi:hypothetical protein
MPQQTNSRMHRPDSGIVFGGTGTVSGEQLSLFVRGEAAIMVSLLVHTFHGDRLLKLKLSQLKNMRGAIDHAIKWLEEKNGSDQST